MNIEASGSEEVFRWADRYKHAKVDKAFFVPKPCNHCTNPPCVQLCPVGATCHGDGAERLLHRHRRALTPFLVLSYMIWRGTTGRPLVFGITLSSCLVLFSVFMMRWNVAIGGQEISKTGKGLLFYHMPLLSKEGGSMSAVLIIAPLVLLWGISKLFPPSYHGTVSSRVVKPMRERGDEVRHTKEATPAWGAHNTLAPSYCGLGSVAQRRAGHSL